MTLPAGWCETTLGGVADFVMGQAPPGSACNTEGSGTPFVKAGEFGNTRPIIREWTTKPLKMAENSDVLICVVGATAGKLNLGSDCAIGRSVAAIRPSEATSAEFIYPRLRSEVSRLRSSSMGTAQGVISKDMLSEITVALPPCAEQRRIVAKLDALIAHLARARIELDRVLMLAHRLRKNALASAFMPNGMKLRPLGELLSDVRYGTAQKCNYNAGKSPVLRIPNIQSGKIDLSDIKSANFTNREIEKLSLKAGDILVIRSNGSIELVGRSAVVESDAVGMLYAGYLIRLRPIEDLVISKFLNYFLLSPNVRETLTSGAKSTSGVNNVNAQQLQALLLPVREIGEQQAIVAHLDTIFARADRLEAEALRARALIDRLETSILAKAFRGELVPQDPADEPASALLERIRAQRSAAPKMKRGRKSQAVTGD